MALISLTLTIEQAQVLARVLGGGDEFTAQERETLDDVYDRLQETLIEIDAPPRG